MKQYRVLQSVVIANAPEVFRQVGDIIPESEFVPARPADPEIPGDEGSPSEIESLIGTKHIELVEE